MHRLELAIERVVERMVRVHERQMRESEMAAAKPKPEEIRAAFEELLLSENFDADLAQFEATWPGSFEQLTALRLRQMREVT